MSGKGVGLVTLVPRTCAVRQELEAWGCSPCCSGPGASVPGPPHTVRQRRPACEGVYPDWGTVGTAEKADVLWPSAKEHSVRHRVGAFAIGGLSPAGCADALDRTLPYRAAPRQAPLRSEEGKRRMDEERIQMVVDYYKATETPYLLMLYAMSDHSDEAYEAFRRLLTERHVAIPPPSAARRLSARHR